MSKKYSLNKKVASIAILGMGPSLLRYVGAVFRNKGQRITDEVWVINHGGYFLRDYDLIVAMDDMRWKQAEEGYEGYIDNLVRQNMPILTSMAYPEYKNAITYPTELITKEGMLSAIDFEWPLTNNSAVYAVMLALHKQVKDLYLFGMDFKPRKPISRIKEGDPYWRVHHLPENLPAVGEPGEDSLMYMLGKAAERGINLHVPKGSTLFNLDLPPYFYGYVHDQDEGL